MLRAVGGECSPNQAATATRAESGNSTTVDDHPDVQIHLTENKVCAAFDESEDRDPKQWVLDTGASNHMSRSRSVFSNINPGVTGSMRFGDGSVARMEGIGTVLLSCKTGEHRTIDNVYFLPRLAANIIYVGQLDEIGYLKGSCDA